MNKNRFWTDRVLRAAVIAAPVMAVFELAVSQLSIQITRLSTAETAGIALFAFIMFGMVTLFAVSHMGESALGRLCPAALFSAAMNVLTALAAVWYLRLLFTDEMFFRNLLFVLDRRTRAYEPLPLSRRIAAVLPLAFVMLGAAVYLLSGLAILTAGLSAGRTTPKKEQGGE